MEYEQLGKGKGKGTGPRGRMGGFGLGPSGNCYYPNCGIEVPHERGVPCYTIKCPQCGKPMTRKV